MNIVKPRTLLHFVHGEKYPNPANPDVIEIVFRRAGCFGVRPPAENDSYIRVGWVEPQINAFSETVSAPFFEALTLLRLISCPILDPANCMSRGEDMAHFLKEVSRHVHILIVASSTHTALYAELAGKFDIPLINAEFVARFIQVRQRQENNINSTEVWRALLEVALRLLPDDNA